MPHPFWRRLGWLCRQAPVWVIALLILVILVESVLLYQQHKVNEAIDAQSAKLLTTFLKGDTTEVSGASTVAIRLRNVRFKWSDKVYIDTGNMAVRAVPLKGTAVDFDDLESFYLTLQQSVVTIRPDVLEGMLNESVFNYPDSRVRDLKVALGERDGRRGVRLTGSIFVVVWMPFKMFAHLVVDTRTNTLVMVVDNVKALGVLPATKLIKGGPFSLAKLISLPPNKTLMVSGMNMMVKPFGLFPPPRINGRMAGVTVDDKVIRLSFAGGSIPAPRASARNYVYLTGGQSQFGNFRMRDTDVLIVDRTPDTLFGFSLLHYADLIPRSRIDVHDTRSVKVTMPDY